MPVDRPLTAREWVAAVVVTLMTVAIGLLLGDSGSARTLMAVLLCCLATGICARSSRDGIVVVLIWLVFVGWTRRIVTTFQADPGSDPLLAVGVVGVAVLGLRAIRAGCLRGMSWLAWGVAAMTALSVVTVVNPHHDSAQIALLGIVYWAVPMVWFWVGRSLLGRAGTVRVLLVVGMAAVATAAYGLWQTEVGFPSWDDDWIAARGYQSLVLGHETFRPFGFATSGTGYAAFLAAAMGLTGVLAVRAMWPPGRATRSPAVAAGAAAVFAFTGIALVLSSVRLALLLSVLALAIVVPVVLGRSAWTGMGALVAVGAVAVAVFNRIDPDSLSRTGIEARFRRVVVGIGHPFGDEWESTYDERWGSVTRGLKQAVLQPLGSGPGQVGQAVGRLGGERLDGETDIANASIAFGMVGLVLMTAVIVVTLVVVYRVARRSTKVVDAAALVLLVTSFGDWWEGAHWFMAPLLWLFVGRADARYSEIGLPPSPFARGAGSGHDVHGPARGAASRAMAR